MNKITFLRIHSKIAIKDFVQKYCMPYLALFLLASSIFSVSKNKKIKRLMTSHRYYPWTLTSWLVKKNLSYIQKNALNIFDGADTAGEDIQKSRAIVLKNPTISAENKCIEKGIFLIKFTGTFQFYIEKIDITELQKYFFIVLEPSWSGYCLAEILWWSQHKDPVFIEASEALDFNFVKSISKNLIPLPFGSGDWVNSDVFYPISPPVEKAYDVVYVSNHNAIKRNHLYLKTISEIEQKNFKAALVCSGWGNSRDYTLALIKKLQIENKVEIIEKLSQEKLNIILNKSKVNILLSLKEGSNRSLFEGFFSGTPGIILKNNIGVNKSHFTVESGSVITEAQLAETLQWYSAHWLEKSAYNWATNNISFIKTTEKLDSTIKNYSNAQGMPWSNGSAYKVNSPEATYYDASNVGRLIRTENIIAAFDKRSKNSELGIAKMLMGN